MKNLRNIFLILAGVLFLFSSCVKDLDTTPVDPDDVTAARVYETPEGYKQVLAKLYAGLAVSGQDGPAGQGDISGIDEGFGQYLRGYWYHQEFPTDEALIAWNDQTVKDFHWHTWGSSDVFIAAMYYRLYYQIVACNEFVKESTDEKLDEREISDADKTEIANFRAEARFLRALSYWHALDLFGSVPFVTEEDPLGSFMPEQITKKDLFNYIESELLEVQNLLVDARANEYGRADKGAAWMLLAKLYLNAEVYIGQEKYTDALTYIKKVIDAGYTLTENYEHLFLADNDHLDEVIFSINYDGFRTQTYGGTNFIIHSAVGGTMDPAEFGVGGGWGGLRTTKEFVYKFYPNAAKSLQVSPQPKNLKSYPVIEVPGAHQGWDPATAPQLASVNSDDVYEGYVWFPTTGNAFKFTQGGSWAINWGDTGADGTLEPEGTDIVAGDAGYYFITVDLVNMTYTLLKTEWGIIGSATANGWDSDQDMTYDAETGLWTATLELVAGEIKFRANDDWTLNYGDDGVDGILEMGGANIVIEASGNYIITMKLGTPDYTYSIARGSFDKRAMFHTDGQSLEINDVGLFTDGWAITKWKNINSDGTTGQNLDYPDTDFPMFRLADAYLMYAEAVLRGGTGGDQTTALGYINELRERAYGDESGNVENIDLQFILDERARELYWEAHRRTDLIRYDMLTTDKYIWEWKGNTKEGTATDSKYNLFPLPASDVNANTNLTQNPEYGS
ncbi:MAG: RagB/SusD family nutrient uptake outer membrane protein [Bacteroidales bacterium]|nr:RagB/SusD family nutrient uptake outer membrane protein [Bacteroidales bacterium]MDD3009923.1 RagB/SusD family nutrient uptake outer membrane protein [Bacteroidales bacterium]MDY0285072.1 RagB/SusD family nutrient uptake outer membrane protein [Bacteroidales bacterium]HPE86167.1 RagB/SusD family nutrient uptake outer membrane protein [Bacteroidales bacterium]